MKLIVPHTGAIQSSDSRLIRLAQFLGVMCEPFLLEKLSRQPAGNTEKAFPKPDSCLVINPQVIKEWTGAVLPADLVSRLTSQFPYLIVHGLTADPFCDELVKTLSAGRLRRVQRIVDTDQPYEIAVDCREVSGAFSGISFGPVNPANDCILSVDCGKPAVRRLISIGGSPFMALMKIDNTEILFLASADTLDVNHELGDTPLRKYFSRFVPHSMALRYIFGGQCWHPGEHYASLTIDDPLLRPSYGFLNFESLLHLMEEANFSTTIAFIPHNYRRNARQIIELFHKNRNRFAICFHGNDHTAAEFASDDIPRLNTMLGIAESRMDIHCRATGLRCHRVMVFPQEHFSVEAMEVLKSRNFSAAVSSTPHPTGRQVAITLGDIAEPAILRHAGFPLFLRKYIAETEKQDIAFNLFFGKPVLIVDHHEAFRHPDLLVEAITMINSLAPEIRWSDLETAVTNSILKRRAPDGSNYVRAYSNTVRVTNDEQSQQRYIIEWKHLGQCPFVEQVVCDGRPFDLFEADEFGIRLSVELTPGDSNAFSVVYRNDYSSLEDLGFCWSAKAYIRRRICELRDNYISKNRHATALADVLRRSYYNRFV